MTAWELEFGFFLPQTGTAPSILPCLQLWLTLQVLGPASLRNHESWIFMINLSMCVCVHICIIHYICICVFNWDIWHIHISESHIPEDDTDIYLSPCGFFLSRALPGIAIHWGSPRWTGRSLAHPSSTWLPPEARRKQRLVFAKLQSGLSLLPEPFLASLPFGPSPNSPPFLCSMVYSPQL